MPNRVSTAQTFANAHNQVTTAKNRETISAEKAATQKEIVKPSQDPAGWTVAANLKDDLSIRERVAKNASMATHFLTATDNTLGQLQEIVTKTHQVSIQASGNPGMPEGKFKYLLPEAEGLYHEFIQTLNTRFANRPVFGGFQSENPFDINGQFSGDDGKIEMEIDRGLKVQTNVSGRQLILGEGVPNGINIIENFQNLLAGLQLEDQELVRASLDGLNAATDQLSLGRTQLAGVQTEISRVLQTHQVHEEATREAVSKIEDVDAVKVFSDLARDQTVLKAALETNRKVLSETGPDALFK